MLFLQINNNNNNTKPAIILSAKHSSYTPDIIKLFDPYTLQQYCAMRLILLSPFTGNLTQAIKSFAQSHKHSKTACYDAGSRVSKALGYSGSSNRTEVAQVPETIILAESHSEHDILRLLRREAATTFNFILRGSLTIQQIFIEHPIVTSHKAEHNE